MKFLKPFLFLTLALALPMAQAGTLDNIRQRGVLVAGVKDSLPPFGYVDPATRAIVGYDVDVVRALADRLGVKLELKPVTSANRIPQLVSGNIDIIAATMTKNPERAQQIDFSHAYFLTGQKFLVAKGTVKSLKDLEGKRIATAKGSTSEQNAKRAVPTATVLSFDDYPQAFLALRQKRVAAVTTDEAILAGILAKAPDKARFEIPALRISDEPYGLGMRKGDAEFVAFVNRALLEMEKSGEAGRIFDKWFGPKSEAPMKRDFVISADK
jgi:polar amino acid transport system substrate-binding protein